MCQLNNMRRKTLKTKMIVLVVGASNKHVKY